MGKKQILSAILVILLVNVACGGSQLVPINPTEPPAPPPTKQAGGQATGSDKSDSNGQVQFQDPISSNMLTVTLEDEQTSQPVENIETWFVSNGTEVLVIVHDPSERYPDTVRELRYSELSLQDASGPKVAAPAKELTLAAVLILVRIVTLYQDFTEWRAYLQDFPDIETWSREAVQLCMTPEQAGKGVGLLSDLFISFVSGGLFGEKEMAKAIKEIFDELAQEQTGNFLDGYASTQTPSILRFTVFSFKEGFPTFLRVDGFCLDPLDRRDPGSTLRWLLYGIEKQEYYAFRNLVGSEFFGYTNYIEGGDPVNAQKFLQDLEPRLKSSQVSCEGYEASDGTIRVWTKGWSPAWKMTQMCYVGCEVLNPPYQSDQAGFFLYDNEGEWTLTVNYLNEPRNFYFGDYALTSCDQPERLEVNASPVPEPLAGQSCPSAPPQRMAIKEKGYVCTQKDNVFLRSEPSRAGEVLAKLAPGTSFSVVDGPQCGADWSWWKVRTEQGSEGWVSEGGDEIDPYFICPGQ